MGVQTWAEAGEVMVRQWIGYAGPELEIRYSMISHLQIFRFVADPPESVFGVQHFSATIRSRMQKKLFSPLTLVDMLV